MPFKTFVDGQILTAQEVNEFMMNQQVMVFADATARGTAITEPVHGMITYLEDANRLSFYNGTQWRLI